MKYVKFSLQVYSYGVAPVRERGLKCGHRGDCSAADERRSREGAWIEIGIISSQPKRNRSRSREGAWIEILATPAILVHG